MSPPRTLLDRVCPTCGSVIDSPYAMRKNPAHSMAWSWWVYSANAVDIIEQMLPYLTVKREKAEMALEQFAQFTLDMTD